MLGKKKIRYAADFQIKNIGIEDVVHQHGHLIRIQAKVSNSLTPDEYDALDGIINLYGHIIDKIHDGEYTNYRSYKE